MSKAPETKPQASGGSPPRGASAGGSAPTGGSPPNVSPTSGSPPEGPPPAGTPARNSPLSPPGGRRLDPAAIMIGVGGVVLLLAVWWLLVTPRSAMDDGVDPARVAQIEQRVSALDTLRSDVGALGGRLEQIQPLEGRIRALEERPAPTDTSQLQARADALSDRVAAAERSAAQATERATALDRQVQALEGRPAFNPEAVASREALERLTERVETQGNRLEEQTRTQDQRNADAQDAANRRATELEQNLQQRIATLEQRLGERLDTLEQAQQRLTAIESRTARLAVVDRLRGALVAGQPLGEALQRIDQPPQALARFASTPPPTEASLRLSFEEAANAARAASDAGMQPDGSRTGVVDSALSRLSGLVTIRRGEEVVWGDAAEAEIERARRALEAGDIDMSLQHIGKLPPPARNAMQPWAEQAQALLAARAALRQLAAG